MTPVRFLMTVGLVLLVAAPAVSQGIRYSPTTSPERPIIIGTRPLLPPYLRPWPPFSPGIQFGWPYGGPTYFPLNTAVYSGPTMSYYPPATGFGTAIPLVGAGGTPPAIPTSISPEMQAELTIEFPVDAEVTVNGTTDTGTGRVRTLTSPLLTAGLTHTFAVKARWTQDGKDYEWERTVTVGQGERSRITVARGFPVSDKE